MASAATLVQPSGEMWKKIRVELNEDVNTRQSDLEAIKEWLRKQPHLPDEWDEGRIMTFLRGSSFSLEKCKRKLDMYFTMRAACPEFFTNRDITSPELADLVIKAQGPPLPGLTPNGRRVTVCKGLDKNIDTNQINEAFKVAMMIGDVRLQEEIEGVAGDVYILDASIVSPSHLGKISPAAIKKFLICVQEAYPIKLKEVHIVNTSPIIETVINLVKPFLKEKIKNRGVGAGTRWNLDANNLVLKISNASVMTSNSTNVQFKIFIHTDMNTLYEYVPRDMLPEEYGGNAGSMNDINEAWMKKLEDYRDWFKAQESVVANEALRPGKPTNYDELFGIDGSFRQLSID